MKTHLVSHFATLLALAGPAVAQNQIPVAERTPIRIEQTAPAQFPRKLDRTQVMQGEAWVVINVDATGKLIDVLVTGYTRREFADEAVAALRLWEYQPATVRGEPWPTVRELHFDFARTGVVVDFTGLSLMLVDMEKMLQDRVTFRARSLRELDRIPVPVQMASPVYPQEWASAGKVGNVTVEFYIDATGQVRIPAVLQWDKPELAYAAVQAVRQWKFEPPLVRGEPVLVLARQEFHFSPKR